MLRCRKIDDPVVVIAIISLFKSSDLTGGMDAEMACSAAGGFWMKVPDAPSEDHCRPPFGITFRYPLSCISAFSHDSKQSHCSKAELCRFQVLSTKPSPNYCECTLPLKRNDAIYRSGKK
jgi:hypothetical protein